LFESTGGGLKGYWILSNIFDFSFSAPVFSCTSYQIFLVFRFIRSFPKNFPGIFSVDISKAGRV